MNDIFQQALDHPSATRAAYLEHACGGDTSLRLRIESMLRDHSRSDALIDSPVWQGEAEQKLRFRTGEKVAGRYEIVRFVAKGGMGEVYEAKDLEFGDAVALKTLLPEIADMDQMVRRFKREIQLCRKISHPNVCKMYDLTRHPLGEPSPSQTICLTMEFLEGETLQTDLDENAVVSTRRALRILTEVADALEAAHAAGVVHRDLKASNIMMTPTPAGGQRAVVMDFGLARLVHPRESDGRLTETGKILGTWTYLAPELLGGGQPSPASDIYALGILAYLMVTGKRPFYEDSPITGVIRRSREAVPAPSTVMPSLPPHWDRAILGCLDVDPAKRYERASLFATDLINWNE